MDQIDRVGVNAVESIILRELKWIFREQPISDWGIDAQIEITDGEQPTGKLIALQIKSGKSFFRKRNKKFIFYGEGRHLRYWRNHSLPVLVVLHNPGTGLTIWQRIEEPLIRHGKDGNWSVEIPETQTLDRDAAVDLVKGVYDIAAIRKLRLALDLPLLREFSQRGEVYFSIDEWVNKSLGFRDVRVFFNMGDIENGRPASTIGAWYPTHSIEKYMATVWPWLSYEYTGEIPPCTGFDEVESHDIRVQLNEIGKAFLRLEEYYEKGAEIIEPEYGARW